MVPAMRTISWTAAAASMRLGRRSSRRASTPSSRRRATAARTARDKTSRQSSTFSVAALRYFYLYFSCRVFSVSKRDVELTTTYTAGTWTRAFLHNRNMSFGMGQALRYIKGTRFRWRRRDCSYIFWSISRAKATYTVILSLCRGRRRFGRFVLICSIPSPFSPTTL